MFLCHRSADSTRSFNVSSLAVCEVGDVGLAEWVLELQSEGNIATNKFDMLDVIKLVLSLSST